MNVKIYPRHLDAFTVGDIGTWARNNGCDLVLELHLNAFSDPQANGYETLTDFNQRDGQAIKDIHAELVKLGQWRNRGFKPCNGGGGRNLSNPRRVRNVGIQYALLEFCFITNTGDMSKYDSVLNRIGSTIVETARKSGVKNLGIVYGHGGRDVGAVGVNGRYERDEVRKISFNAQSSTPSQPITLPTQSIGEVVVTASTLNIRSQANTSSNIIGQLHRSHKRDTFKLEGDFYQIVYDGQIGYLHKKFVEFTAKKPNINSGKDELDMTREQLDQLLDERDAKLKSEVVKEITDTLIRPSNIADTDATHWANTDLEELNKLLQKLGVDIITSKQLDDLASRGVVIRIAKLLADAFVKSK